LVGALLPKPAARSTTPTSTDLKADSCCTFRCTAGPRIFIGKLNKDTSEQDVKDHFMRFGFVLDVYLPRGERRPLCGSLGPCWRPLAGWVYGTRRRCSRLPACLRCPDRGCVWLRVMQLP
jgi:hypothetical protein